MYRTDAEKKQFRIIIFSIFGGLMGILYLTGSMSFQPTAQTPVESTRDRWIRMAPQYAWYLTNSDGFNQCLINEGNQISIVRDDYVKRANEVCRYDPAFKLVPVNHPGDPAFRSIPGLR